MLRQINLFRVSRVPQRCSGIFKVSNAWTNMWNKMMKEKERVKRQNSKKHADIVEKVSVVSDSNASPYLKLACPTQKNQSSKPLQF